MMKKILILMFVLMATSAFAAPKYRGTSEALRLPGTPRIQAFDNVSTVGTTFPVNPGFAPDQGTMQVVVNGSPSAWEIAIEWSIVSEDGPWVGGLSLPDTNGLHGGHYALKPQIWQQIRLVSKTGSGAFDVYFLNRGN